MTVVAPLGAVRELLTLPVMKSETINALYVCPVTPVITKETINEQSTHPVSVKESKFKLYLSRFDQRAWFWIVC